MFYYLTKVLPLLLMPVFVALALMVLALIFVFSQKRKGAAASLLAAIAVLWIASLPVVAGQMLWSLEKRYQPVPFEDIPSADCIVVLGGAVGSSGHPGDDIDLTDSTDRVYQAARLYRNGKGKAVIVAAGNQPWSRNRVPEARVISELLTQWGVSDRAIALDNASKTTRENAINAAELLREKGCHFSLLVTSAWHMPRAAAVFKKVGLNVFPVSVDARGAKGAQDSIAWFLPQADALAATSLAIREWMGIVVYRWRGWI